MFPQLSAIAAFAVVVALSWLYRQLLRQNGRMLLRVHDLENRFVRLELGQADVDSLPVNSPAPDFDLAGLYGKRKTLADFRGQSLLLIFFNPACSFCRDLVPSLGALGIVNPQPLILSIGDVGHSRRFFADHQLPFTVLLQQDSKVVSAYRVKGTPSGYLIDAESNIASELAVGGERLLALAHQSSWNHSLERSKIKRDGPRLDGLADFSLSAFCGRRSAGRERHFN